MTTAKVSLRGTELTAETELSQRDGDTAFVALDHPPPVGAVLEVVVDGQVRGLRVASIDERGLTGSGAGCVGRWIDETQLAEGRVRVGSEQLVPTAGEVGASRPAPVVVTDEPSGVIDMGVEGAAPDTGAEPSAEAERDGAGSTDDADAGPPEAGEREEDGSEGNGEDTGKRPKKRKGRKRS